MPIALSGTNLIHPGRQHQEPGRNHDMRKKPCTKHKRHSSMQKMILLLIMVSFSGTAVATQPLQAVFERFE
jgi:hypothetical protein